MQPSKSCWSCRTVSGGGMILAGAYVYYEARKFAQRSGHTVGTAAQATLAIGLAVFGLVVIVDPVGTMKRKT